MRRLGQNTHRVGKGARALASGAAFFLGLALTAALFVLLPLLENIGQQTRDPDLQLVSIDAVEAPPPPPEIEEQREEPPTEEEAPPELTETAQPLDLSQLELALNVGAGGGDFGGDFAVKLNVGAGDAGLTGAGDDIFALADLDQPPRVIFQPAPQYPADLKKKKIQGTVHVLFIVDKDGRAQNPRVQKSDNAGFDAPALNAVRKWRFEPGKVGGQSVQFRMRVPVTFAL